MEKCICIHAYFSEFCKKKTSKKKKHKSILTLIDDIQFYTIPSADKLMAEINERKNVLLLILIKRKKRMMDYKIRILSEIAFPTDSIFSSVSLT